ncbi:MAG: NAD(P)-dependent oxidoreductase, partial [Chloroflexota bacterium]
ATVGPLLKLLADEAGVVYSDVDGDEPGILTDLVHYARGIGFPPILAGNCKGVLKRWATPATQAAFATAHGLQPWIATAAADGTKLNCEMAVVANATGMPPAGPGMTGISTSLDALVADLDRAGLLALGPVVEYVFGIPNGVFVIFRADEPALRRDFEYLKMGTGPYYLLHRPHVLVHYTAPLSAAAAAMYGCATVAPAGAPVAEVIACAKRPLPAGTSLDGIGGFDCYGMVHRQEQSAGLLPIGLARGATLQTDLPRDAPIPCASVDLTNVDSTLLDLRRRQEAHFGLGTLSRLSAGQSRRA